MSTIKCRTCSSPMVVDRCESSGHATTCWHQCPVCKQVRLTSEYDSAHGKRAATAQADEESGIAGEHEIAYGPGYTL